MSNRYLSGPSPYLGLIPYGEMDAPFFFGRERDTRVVASNLRTSALTVLYGSSGVGKSSILRAGVIPLLRERQDVIVLSFSDWQQPPVPALKAAVADALRTVGVETTLPSEDAKLADYLAGCAALLNRRLLIILDQFDEYFLYHPENDPFATEFPRAVMHPDASANFIISLREDSLAKLDLFAHRLPLLFNNLLRVEHLDVLSARKAIERPIEQYNLLNPDLERPITIQPELVETVITQIKTGEVVIGDAGRGSVSKRTEGARVETPFMQLVMTRLWIEEAAIGSHTLRLETLERLGGAANVVRTHLDAVMTAFGAAERNLAARVFNYLVTPSGTKIAHTLEDLATYAEVSAEQIKPVLNLLSSSEMRILRVVFPSSDQLGEARYEIFHDVLAPAILDWRARYVSSAAADAARAEIKMIEQRRFAKRIRALTATSGILLLLTVAVAVYATRQYQIARESERTATEMRKRADEARAQAQVEAEIARRALEEAQATLKEVQVALSQGNLRKALESGSKR